MKSCSYCNSGTLATIVEDRKRVRDNLCVNGCVSSSNLSKTVDICGAEVSFHVLSDDKEGLLCDSIQRKSILENAIINSYECTRFLMWLPCYYISCIYKATKKSNYIYTLLVYSENHKQTIQFSKNINGTASLAEAVRNASLLGITKYNLHHVHDKINVDSSERKKKITDRNKTMKQWNYQRKKIFLEKQQVRDMTNSHELKMNGHYQQTRCAKQKSSTVQNNGHC